MAPQAVPAGSGCVLLRLPSACMKRLMVWAAFRPELERADAVGRQDDGLLGQGGRGRGRRGRRRGEGDRRSWCRSPCRRRRCRRRRRGARPTARGGRPGGALGGLDRLPQPWIGVMTAQSSQWAAGTGGQARYPAAQWSGFSPPDGSPPSMPPPGRRPSRPASAHDPADRDRRRRRRRPLPPRPRRRAACGSTPGEAEAADVTLVQSREVAAALSRGELNAQQALEAGRLKLRGDIGHLARQGKALTAVEDLFAAVRAATSY